MATIQVVLDDQLLKTANREAKQAKTNRSAVIRQAMREHFERQKFRAKVEQDRRGYLRMPDTGMDPEWEAEAVWE